MATISLKSGRTQLGLPLPYDSIVRPVQLGATLSAGAPVKASGSKMVAHTGTTLKPTGLIMQGGGDGDWVDMVIWGWVTGYDLSSKAYDLIVKANAGTVDDTTGADFGKIYPSQVETDAKMLFINCLP